MSQYRVVELVPTISWECVPQVFELQSLPLPIIHSDFVFDLPQPKVARLVTEFDAKRLADRIEQLILNQVPRLEQADDDVQPDHKVSDRAT